MNKVIISGASGYFGKLATYYLEESGVKVLSAGRAANSDIHFDLDFAVDFASTKISENIDAFIHAAATHEVDCVNYPYKCVSRNVAGTRAALDFCVNNGIKTFIYISTFHVYGTDVGIISEQTPPKPNHDYGLTHLQAEEYVRMYTRKGLINGISVRPSNMFDLPISLDDFNRWSLIPFGFCKSAVNDGEIVLKTTGMQERNFVSVRDIVKVIKMIFNNKLTFDVINIPGVSTYSIRDFANMVKRIMLEEFSKSVEVIVPEGGLQNNVLTYMSNYFKPDDLEFLHIEDHVINFCKELIKND